MADRLVPTASVAQGPRQDGATLATNDLGGVITRRKLLRSQAAGHDHAGAQSSVMADLAQTAGDFDEGPRRELGG